MLQLVQHLNWDFYSYDLLLINFAIAGLKPGYESRIISIFFTSADGAESSHLK